MKERELEEIRARATAASSGPWSVCDGEDCNDPTCMGLYDSEDRGVMSAAVSEEQGRANAVFTAHARTDVPNLLTYVEKLEDMVRELEDYAANLEEDIQNLEEESV